MEGGEHAPIGQASGPPTHEGSAAQQGPLGTAEPGPPSAGGGPAPVVAGVAGTADGPIYVSKREVRKHAGKVMGKKAAYFLEFYLVDNHGYETLAATGEDQGDRHAQRHDVSCTTHPTMHPVFREDM